MMLLVWPTLAAAQAPPVERRILDNGLVLVVAPRPGLPVVRGIALLGAGTLDEDSGQAGIAALTARLILRGTATRSGEQISQAIEAVGGSLEAEAERNAAVVGLSVLTKDLRLGLSLLADTLRNPTFPEAELERERRNLLAGLAQRAEEPGLQAQDLFATTLYGLAHPYGRPVAGTEATLRQLRRDEIIGFHRRWYGPNRVILVLAGDITLAVAEPMVREVFGNWVPVVSPAWHSPSVGPISRGAVRTLDRKLAQTTVILGQGGIARNDPEYYAATVLNAILGGSGLTSRLGLRLREEGGLVYSVGSSLAAGRLAGPLQVALQTKNESAGEAVRQVIQEIRRLRSEPVPAEELRRAQAFLTGNLALQLDTTGKLAAFLARAEYYGLGLDLPARYPGLIAAVTPEDVRRVAQRILDPDRLVIAVVGGTAAGRIEVP
jgi:zinc protease